jgi:hypothetical protein
MADLLSTIFGAGAQKDAAAANQQALQLYADQTKNILGQTYGTGQGALQTGYGTGMGALQSGYGTGMGALQQGYGAGQTALNSAIGAYTPLANLGQQYGQAGNLLMGSLGLGGPQATQAAQAAFQNNPGYTSAVNAGLDVLNRRQAAAGMLNSGNADINALTFGQNLQNQQYGNWQQQLAALAQQGQAATSGAAGGQASGYGQLANLGQTYGQNVANIAQNLGTNVASTAANYGQNLANLASQYGQNISGVNANQTSGVINDNQMVAAGEAAGAKNLLTAGMGLATLGLGGNPFGGSLMGGGSALASAGGGGGFQWANTPLAQLPGAIKGLFS